MNAIEPIKITAEYVVQLRDPTTKEILKEIKGHNLHVNTGKNHVANRIAGLNTGTYLPIGYIGIGTDNTAATVTDTALGSEVDRQSMSASYPQFQATGQAIFFAEWGTSEPSGQPHTLYEMGLFDDITGGNMFNRIVFSSGVTKDSSIEMTAKIIVTVL